MRDRLFNLIRSDTTSSKDDSPRISANSDHSDRSIENSSYSFLTPNMAPSPFVKSPLSHSTAAVVPLSDDPSLWSSLVGSMIREHGHLYSLATANGLLYTGSGSKNIRVWKNLAKFSEFKSSSGLVKAIVVSGEKIFTGHQDGKIRIWRMSAMIHKRIGTLPRLKDFLKSSINPSAYVQVRRRHRTTVWLKHFDAVSSLSLDEEVGILYSGSWDKTFKAWRISDSRCLESVNAHDDAINSLVVGFNGLVFTGSADGTVKVWRREIIDGGKSDAMKHVLIKILLNQESAVTALVVSRVGSVVYCGSSDGAINYWEIGMMIVPGGSIRGHKMAVLCLATAGRLVVSGSADRTIRVWRREEGGAHVGVSVLTGHTGPIKCLAMEEGRGGRWVLYSGSLDKSVKVWRVVDEPHVMKQQHRT